ncbi:hypothetical protein ABZ619_38885 [Streptomyces sp. NPDC007851]|uniref:hypothetical protein n=1 Tax=Streptomyces sp. NPDC007851 TaxID=3155008 RepID=UPI0033C490F2
MSSPLDVLHGLVNNLEDEGHVLAARFRDLVDEFKDKFGHLIGGGADELDAFVSSLVGKIAPELETVKEQIVTAVVAELAKLTAEVKATVEDVVQSAEAPAPVEPQAPAQG